jgi:CRISPR/Cas system-associated exonuclease Cas4 (RecB family)
VASTRALQHAPWSSSKVQCALRCPREFHYKYIDKVPAPEELPEARIGKAVHAVLEHALSGTSLAEALAAGREALKEDTDHRRYDAICEGVPAFLERIAGFRRRRRVARQLVEFTLAVREDFTPTTFYSGDAFYRGIFDAGYLYDDGNLALIDHKTGVRRPSTSIIEQLEGYAVLAAPYFRNVRRFWLGVHWVACGDVEWSRPIEHIEINQRFVPSVVSNIEAAALAVSDGPRPNPSPWCAHCSYRSLCPAAMEELLEPVDEPEPEDWEY